MSSGSEVKLSGLAEEFASSFSRVKEQLELRIVNLKDVKNVPEEIADISRELQKLSKSLHDATTFLPSYSVKRRQEDVRAMETRLKEQEDILMPKKKFGFKSRVQNGKPKLVPEVVPEAVVATNGITVKDVKSEQPADSHFVTVENVDSSETAENEDKLNGADVMVRNLESKVIRLNGTPSTLRLSNLKNCTVACGPVLTSVFVENCDGCKLYLCCQQLRTHSSTETDIYLRVRARAIIEDCSKLRFGPYLYDHPKMADWHEKAGIDSSLETYSNVDDFNWLNKSHSPNWTLLPEDARLAISST